MNKRGDMATFLLLVIALALAVAGGFAMLTYDNSTSGESKKVAELLSQIEFNQEYVLSSIRLAAKESIVSCSGCSVEDIKNFISRNVSSKDWNIKGQGNSLRNIEEGNFEFNKEDSSYTLSSRDLFVVSQVGDNYIKRNFDLVLKFDSKGILIYQNVSASVNKKKT